ncbi:keratin 98 [Pimephales promelas]|uniref:keratin 98 n=1 Tax=Pimephales promelas TaxID=90988 RepID=UPI001955B462|nr:keratin 98 [Pimephales promelas]
MSVSSNFRTISVYGGAGGQSSSPDGFLHSSPRRLNLGDAFDSSAGEKTTMQDLNSRLASYIEKVHSLENAKADLETKISDWFESRTGVTFDHSIFQDTINDLTNEIQSTTQDRASIILNLDNAKLAAEDYQLKYENELAMRRTVDADVASLRKILDKLRLSQSDLEMKIEALNDDRVILKRNHEEKMSLLAGVQLNVCEDAAPPTDLNQAIDEIGPEDEPITEKTHQELESWFENKITTVQQEVATHNEELQKSRIELRELARSFRRLQTELQTNQSTRSALVEELEGTQARYGNGLAMLQATVTGLEDHLSQFRAEIGQNKQDYKTLLEVKSKLVHEITGWTGEFKRLLDGDERESH